MKTRKLMALGLAAIGTVGVGFGVAANLPVRTSAPTTAADASVAEMLAARSPGARSGAAVTSKPLRTQWTPTFPAAASREVGSSAEVPVEGPKLAMASPPPAAVAEAVTPAIIAAPSGPIAAAGAAAPPAALAASPPVAVASVAGSPAVLAAAPIAAGGGGSLVGAAAILPAIPILLASGGGNSGGGPTMTAPVPEPATWLMMISGFGVLGLALRRRRRELRATPTRGQAKEPLNGLTVARAN